MGEEKRYAVVKDGKVINIIVWDGEQEYDAPDCTLVQVNDYSITAGWDFDGAQFSKIIPV